MGPLRSKGIPYPPLPLPMSFGEVETASISHRNNYGVPFDVPSKQSRTKEAKLLVGVLIPC